MRDATNQEKPAQFAKIPYTKIRIVDSAGEGRLLCVASRFICKLFRKVGVFTFDFTDKKRNADPIRLINPFDMAHTLSRDRNKRTFQAKWPCDARMDRRKEYTDVDLGLLSLESIPLTQVLWKKSTSIGNYRFFWGFLPLGSSRRK
jgi:hypothetical protein